MRKWGLSEATKKKVPDIGDLFIEFRYDSTLVIFAEGSLEYRR